MNKQKENVEELLRLIEENPELRIVPMVDSDIVASDDFGWWTAAWGSALVDEIWNSDERCYIRSDDEEELVNDAIENSGYDLLRTDEENEAWGKGVVDAYEWEKVIMVRITTI